MRCPQIRILIPSLLTVMPLCISAQTVTLHFPPAHSHDYQDRLCAPSLHMRPRCSVPDEPWTHVGPASGEVEVPLGREFKLYFHCPVGGQEVVRAFGREPLIDINFLRISDGEAAGILAAVPQPWRVQVVDFHRSITDDSVLAAIEPMTTLRLLDLWIASDVTDEGLAHLAHLEHLETLCVMGHVTDDGLVHLANLTQMRRLFLGERITDAGLTHLRNMDQLAQLVLSVSCDITDEGLREIGQLTSLRSLDLASARSIPRVVVNPQITDDGIAHLTSLRGLVSLNISGTGITDEGLRHLTDLPDLRQLDLCATQITDEGLRILSELPSLRRMDLYCCSEITGEGLLALANLEDLRYFNVRHCAQITDEDVSALQALLPDCHIIPPENSE